MLQCLEKYYSGDKDQAHFVMRQILCLQEVYKGLCLAWETYSHKNIHEPGPFKDACIIAYCSFPVFDGKEDHLAVFFHEYSVHDEGRDQIGHKLVYAQEEFIPNFLVNIFEEIYFHHNHIHPRDFLRAFEFILSRRIQ